MNSTVITGPRRIVPRWRDFASTAEVGEFEALISDTISYVEPPPLDLSLYDESFGDHPSLFTAGELFCAALSTNSPDSARRAADFIQTHSVATSFAHNIADVYLRTNAFISEGGLPDTSPQTLTPSFIGLLRRQLRDFPRDAIGWTELSLAFAIIGKEKGAERAMTTALGLEGTNRFVARSAARFFVHLDDSERALRVLSKAQARHDPWLLAAHIAVSDVAGKTSGLMKAGKAMSTSGSFSDFSLAELRAAIATTEMGAGGDKRARRLFESVLTSPTENALAQVRWAEQQMQREIVDVPIAAKRDYEAQARFYLSQQNWNAAGTEIRKWLHDEPFSTRPAIIGSFISSVIQEDYTNALLLVKEGLRANPEDVTLINNEAFCLASLNRVDEAIKALNRVSSDKIHAVTDAIALNATLGLIQFRNGEPEEGRAAYRRAIELAGTKDVARSKALALAFFAREEALIKSGFDSQLADEATEIATKNRFSEVSVVLQRIQQRTLSLDDKASVPLKLPR